MDNKTLEAGNAIQAKIAALQKHMEEVKNCYHNNEHLCFEDDTPHEPLTVRLCTEELELQHLHEKLYSTYMEGITAQINKLEKEFAKL